MPLRDYQSGFVDHVIAALRRGDRPVGVLPTGAGKSVCAREIVARLNVPTIFLVHRGYLVRQFGKHLERAGIRFGIIKSGHPAFPKLKVQVASIPTLVRREQAPASQLVIFDECHHLGADTWKQAAEKFPGAMMLGLTATPFRLDGQGLAPTFNRIIVGAYADDLCAAKYLVEPRVYAPPGPSLRDVHTRYGEYVRRGLSDLLDKPKLTADVVETWKKYAGGRTTIVFAVNVAHSQHLAEQFRAAGIPAEHLDAKSKEADREAALDSLESGETLVACNVELFTEGLDVPRVKCVSLARPTQSMALYFQMVGRAMRPAGEESAILLDHAGLVHKFGRVTQRLEYSLEGSVQRGPSSGTGLRTCRQCYRMVLASRTTCPECGADLTTQPELPETEDGDLVELDQEHMPSPASSDSLVEFWEQLEQTTRETGRQPGWACWKFKERFGKWPQTVEFNGRRRLLTPDADESTRLAALEHWQAEAEQRGFKPGYASSRYKELFGVWPKIHGTVMA